jgi:hypothetical protein
VLPKGPKYAGSVTIDFTLSGKDFIFVDYSGLEVGDIIMNGVRLAPANVFYGHKIKLRPENMQIGENQVHPFTIHFANRSRLHL